MHYQLKQIQDFPVEPAILWNFIKSPQNLKRITPPAMGFDIISDEPTEEMYAGMIIAYRVRPFPLYQTQWVTEITHVNEPFYFVDEQRVGPYKIWHHQHLLSEIPGGTRMKDIVTYQPPFGFLGDIANTLIIRKKLNEIFEFRRKILVDKFGSF